MVKTIIHTGIGFVISGAGGGADPFSDLWVKVGQSFLP